MSIPSTSESLRSRIRTLLETIEGEISRLPSSLGRREGMEASGKLLSSLARLVELLALGPGPEVRHCPACWHTCRRHATRCGACWAKLEPPAAAGARATG
jgi:hypothetical protein